MFATHIRRDFGVKDNYQSHRVRQALVIIGVSAIVQWPICGLPVAIGLTLLFVIVATVWASPAARPLGVLLFWPMVINFFCHPFGIYGGGFFLLIPLAGLLLIPVWPSVVRSWRAIPHSVLLIGLGLISWWFVSWMIGPRTNWGTLKLFASVSRLVIGAFALSVCMRAKRNTFLEVGVIGLTVGAFLFAVNCQKSSLSSFGLGVWKEFGVEAEAVAGPRAMGMAVVIQFVFAIIMREPYFLALIGSTLVCAAPTMVVSDSRQMLLGIPLALSCLLVQKHVRVRAIVALCPVVAIVGALVAYALATQHYRYTIFLDHTMSFSDRTFRGQEWETGIDTWRKSPLFGVGLGGYNKDSEHFGRGYPHNLGIEMLTETGLVGFVLGIGFLISSWAIVLHHKRAWVKKDFMMVLSIWAYCFLIAMVSLDIPGNIEVFYFPAAAAMSMETAVIACRASVGIGEDVLV